MEIYLFWDINRSFGDGFKHHVISDDSTNYLKVNMYYSLQKELKIYFFIYLVECLQWKNGNTESMIIHWSLSICNRWNQIRAQLDGKPLPIKFKQIIRYFIKTIGGQLTEVAIYKEVGPRHKESIETKIEQWTMNLKLKFPIKYIRYY